jgi:ribonuclease Z
MAGSFAKLVGAQRLVLNHIGSRFPAPLYSIPRRVRDTRAAIMKEVERQASEEWGMGEAQVAVDFMTVEIHAVREGGDLQEEAMNVERGTRGNNGRAGHRE